MDNKPKVLMAWTGGKDSAWALHTLRLSGEVEVVGLVAAAFQGVQQELLAAQAAALGLPLRRLELPEPCPKGIFEEKLVAELMRAKGEGVVQVAFGDIFAQAPHDEHERLAAAAGLAAIFPLWHRGTALTAEAMILGGLKARVVAVKLDKLPRELCGREYGEDFVCDLPASVDPCGENDEFHTFAYAGPMFSAPVAVKPGAVFERGSFAGLELALEA